MIFTHKKVKCHELLGGNYVRRKSNKNILSYKIAMSFLQQMPMIYKINFLKDNELALLTISSG